MMANEERHICPRCGFYTVVPLGALGPFQGLRCPQCDYVLVPVNPKGMDRFGTVTYYERENESANQIIRESRGWKRPGEI